MRSTATLEAPGTPPPSWLLPAIAYGASGEHQRFPGTVSIGTAVLEQLILEFGVPRANGQSG